MVLPGPSAGGTPGVQAWSGLRPSSSRVTVWFLTDVGLETVKTVSPVRLGGTPDGFQLLSETLTVWFELVDANEGR